MREEGFYWVKVENYEWEIAKYHHSELYNYWSLNGETDLYGDEDIEEIDEKRIIR